MLRGAEVLSGVFDFGLKFDARVSDVVAMIAPPPL